MTSAKTFLAKISRRQFLKRAAAVAAVAAMPSLAPDPANAWVHGTAFNGGKTQIQSNFLFESGDYPFINFCKTGSQWLYGNNSARPDPSTLDSNGYPTSVPASGLFFNCGAIPGQSKHPGNYVLTWQGNGVMSFSGGGASLVSGSLTSSNGSGSATFSFTSVNDFAASVTIASISGSTTGGVLPYIYNIALMHVNDVASYNAQIARGIIAPLGPRYIQVMRQSGAGVLRFLNWQNANNSNVTTWATRKPVGHYSYVAHEYRAALSAGVAVAAKNDYTATLGTGAPTDKQIIHLQFQHYSVTISNASPGVVTWTSHGLSVGDAVAFQAAAGGSVAGGITPLGIYFVSNVIDANNFNISSTFGGSSLNTTSASSGGCFGIPTVASGTAVVNPGSPSTISWTNHHTSVGDPISLNSSNILTNVNDYSPLYVSNIIDANTIEVALTSGGSAAQLSFTCSNFVWSGGTVTVTCPTIPYGTGSLNLVIAGATPSALNGTYVCNITQGVGFTYSLVSNPGTYVSGGQALRSNSCTAVRCLTLSLNSSGAVPFAGPYGNSLAGSGLPNWYLAWGTAIYDATWGLWLLGGPQSNGGDTFQGIDSQIPPEVLMQTAVALGMHPYFVSPMYTLDAPSDYMLQLAAYCKANGPSWMIPRFEICNECFNFFSGFIGQFALRRNISHWGLYEQYGCTWAGMIGSILGQQVASVYGVAGLGTKYHILIGIQTGSPFATVFTAAAFVAGSPTFSGYTNTAGRTWASHCCCTQYISGFNPLDPNATVSGAAYGAACGDINTQNSIAATLGATILNPVGTGAGQNNFGIPSAIVAWNQTFSFAQGFTNTLGAKIRMCGYEGGIAAGNGGAGDDGNNVQWATKYDVNAVGYVLTALNLFAAAGGEFFAFFTLAGPQPTTVVDGNCVQVDTQPWNVWGRTVYDPVYYPNYYGPPQFVAMAIYNGVISSAGGTKPL